MKKIFFFDVDGTLIGKSQKITKRNHQAISLLRKEGHKVFLCTGRMTLSAMGGLEGLEVDGMITLAGGVVQIGDHVIFENSIDKSILKEIIKLFEKYNIFYTLETKVGNFHKKELQEFYLNWIDEHYEEDLVANKLLKEDKIGKYQYDIHDFDTNTTNVQKMMFVSKNKENFEIVKPLLEKQFNINYFSHDDKYVDGELILKDCTKTSGIEKVLQYYNYDISSTVAFGDSMNDYEMLSYVKQAIVFIDAPEEIKSLTNIYFENPDDDGIYKALIQTGFVGSL